MTEFPTTAHFLIMSRDQHWGLECNRLWSSCPTYNSRDSILTPPISYQILPGYSHDIQGLSLGPSWVRDISHNMIT